MSTKVVTIEGGKKVQIYRSDGITPEGIFCSATELRPALGNKLIAEGYLKKPPKDAVALIRRLERP